MTTTLYGPGGDAPASGPTPVRAPRRYLRELVRDPRFRAVLLAWALCCLGQALFIRSYGSSLPWADEWRLVPAATGREAPSWEWLWRPANEHRAPLLRATVLLLGRLGAWDMQVLHYFDLACLAAGALALILAARTLRGRLAASDAFLCLLMLSPWHFETTVLYAYAYAIPGGLLGVLIGLVAVRWPLRSTRNLGLYLLGVLAIALGVGPAGNLWALGLCGIAVAGMFAGTPARWKLVGGFGVALVAAVSGAMLYATPRCPGHEPFRSHSAGETLRAGAKIASGWMGSPPLEVLWPWALVALVVPGLLLLGLLARDLARMAGPRRGEVAAQDWWNLSPVCSRPS